MLEIALRRHDVFVVVSAVVEFVLLVSFNCVAASV